MTSISNDGSSVIRQRISDIQVLLAEISIDYFNLNDLYHWIKIADYKRIGLQVPEYLLEHCVDIKNLLVRNCNVKVFLLGDSNFSSCCLDLTYCKRISVDAIVHFGEACLSQISTEFPVFYQFEDFPSDLEFLKSASQSLELANDKRIIIFYDFRFKSMAKDLFKLLGAEKCYLARPNFTNSNSSYCSRIVDSDSFPFEDSTLLYVGASEYDLLRILCNSSDIDYQSAVVVDPFAKKTTSCVDFMSKFIQRRNFLIEKAKIAKNIGILVGTLSCKGFQETIDRLTGIFKSLRINYTTLLLGKLNESKLMNITDIDLFVLIGCSRSSLLDSREFLIPILTPFELECALYPAYSTIPERNDKSIDHLKRQWNCRLLISDNKNLIDQKSEYYVSKEEFQSSQDHEEASVSLINGQIIHNNNSGGINFDDVTKNSLLSVEEKFKQLASIDENLTKDRSWFGLDTRLGQDPVQKNIHVGDFGIASGYTRENS